MGKSSTISLNPSCILGLIDERGKNNSPIQKILVFSLNQQVGMGEEIAELLDDIPRRWEKFDDIAIIPNSSFKNEHWEPIINEDFWK